MKDVIDFQAERDRRAGDAWAQYVDARQIADATLRFEDGQRAARAWCAFLELYQTPAQNDFMGAAVVRLERRA